jgi:hypothetical protein
MMSPAHQEAPLHHPRDHQEAPLHHPPLSQSLGNPPCRRRRAASREPFLCCTHLRYLLSRGIRAVLCGLLLIPPVNLLQKLLYRSPLTTPETPALRLFHQQGPSPAFVARVETNRNTGATFALRQDLELQSTQALLALLVCLDVTRHECCDHLFHSNAGLPVHAQVLLFRCDLRPDAMVPDLQVPLLPHDALDAPARTLDQTGTKGNRAGCALRSRAEPSCAPSARASSARASSARAPSARAPSARATSARAPSAVPFLMLITAEGKERKEMGLQTRSRRRCRPFCLGSSNREGKERGDREKYRAQWGWEHRLLAHRLLAHRLLAHRLLAHRLLAHRLLAHRLLAHRLLTHRLLARRLLAHRLLAHRLLTHRLLCRF